jgi:tRNA (cmo5U34)-methyltransferase
METNKEKLIIPEGDWTFQSANVAQNFDTHVREQLPWYSLSTGIVAHVGRHYLTKDGLMYDVGASTGNVTKALSKEIESRNVTAISIDNSAAMKDFWQGVGSLEIADAVDYKYKSYDFAVCFLVLMFLSPERQRKLVDILVQNIKEGGALLIFDKTETACGYVGTIMHRLTMAGKMSNGADPKEVIQKELSLAGVQRPIVPTKLLTRHHAVEIFRFGEFAGWIIEAP